jgi:hypothetical protein
MSVQRASGEALSLSKALTIPKEKCKVQTMKKLAPVGSIRHLVSLARTDARYRKLAIDAANNLGAFANDDFDRAIRWLEINASETDEEGVVEEINFCIR